MNLQQAVDVVKDFVAQQEAEGFLEGVELMTIHRDLGLLDDRQRVAIGMFMTAGRKMFAPVDA